MSSYDDPDHPEGDKQFINPSQEVDWDDLQDHYPEAIALIKREKLPLFHLLVADSEIPIDDFRKIFTQSIVWASNYLDWDTDDKRNPIHIVSSLEGNPRLFSINDIYGYFSENGEYQTLHELTQFLVEAIDDRVMEDAEVVEELTDSKPKALNISITPGTAPSEVIAELLADISLLYRKAGGSGINFSFEGVEIHETVEGYE